MTPRTSIRREDLDPRFRPQDDLFRHANQRWIDATPIPPDRARYGTFFLLDERAEIDVRAIIEEAAGAPTGSEARKVGDLYSLFMDEQGIEARGAQPLQTYLARIDSVGDYEGLLGLLGEFTREGVASLVATGVDVDLGDPTRYVVYLGQDGLSLPDESNYKDEASAGLREALLAHAERMFGLAGLDDAAGRARRVAELERAIADGHWNQVDSRDTHKIYNPTDYADLVALVGRPVEIAAFVRGAGLDGSLSRSIVLQPSFLAHVGGLLTDDRLESWRDWMRFHTISSLAPLLSDAFVTANFDFFVRTLTGATQMRDRWKRAVGFVNDAMGEAIGRLYVERHFPPAAKSAMDELVTNLVAAYRDSITTLTWMGPETRTRALDKLAAFTSKVGYPIRWRDYSALQVVPGDLLASALAARAFEFARQLAKLGGPVDRDEWHMTPQTVNAYYNPTLNEIVFPAAILQPPFFDAERDAAENYGAIGAVIGHEIGHGFDDQGSRFDGTGRLADWWEPADREAFERLTARLIEQYDALVPAAAPDVHVNGALTIGENIGDLGGLGIAWKAYRLSLGDQAPPEIDGLSGAQRFFLSWAVAWRMVARPEETRRLITIDPHSPEEFRCNQIARNLGTFHEAFEVGPGDGMWLDPDARVEIW